MNLVHGAVDVAKGHIIEQLIKYMQDFQDTFDPDGFANEDTFFTGYPLLALEDENISLDGLLLSKKYGVVAFELICGEEKISQSQAQERQDFIYNQLYSKVAKYQGLTRGRNLAFNIQIVTIDLFNKVELDSSADEFYIAKGQEAFNTVLQKLTTENISDDLFKKIKSVLQGVSKLRPLKKRAKVQKMDSKGAKIKEIEKQIANLDIYQNKAIVETTKGPQRITGLAGTGKTVVLAGKVAYLHALDPDLEIVVTFYSRSLYQQYKELIRRLYFEYAADEPNWDKIHLLHAWGSGSAPGLYYQIATENGIEAYSYREAAEKFGRDVSFSGCCEESLKSLKNPKELFDVILIDEAQDMPRSFFEICYLSTSKPHRVIWAYDELQQVSVIEQVPGPEILFGKNEDGTSRCQFKGEAIGPEDNIVLKVCYRNPKEIIITAHSLGLAINSSDGPIQMIEDRSVWERIGYQVSGEFTPGNKIVLERDIEASPAFLSNQLSGETVVGSEKFEDEEQQAEWVASEIKKNIEEDELEPSDIMIIHPLAYTLRSSTGRLRALLAEKGIKNHLAGEFDASEYFTKGSVAISHIHRAKGNEAAMVYFINAENCVSGTELIKKRNTLFTAITRARAWVRICGIGPRMGVLVKEIDDIKKQNYKIEFSYPSSEELKKKRKLHREFTESEKRRKKKNLEGLKEIKKAFKKGEISIGDIDQDELREIRGLFLEEDPE